MSKGQVHVHVGDTVDDAGRRFGDAWHRIERGRGVSERHVSFETWETMVRVLSPKRLELLRHVHHQPVKNIRALAQSLGRDYRRVHDDVAALEAAGLLERDKEGVRTEYDAFAVQMRVAL